MPAPTHRILSVLCYVVRDGQVLMMLRRKQPNLGQWTAPGGKLEWDEAPHETCIREMREETGVEARGPYIPLGEIRHKSGKRVTAFAFEGDCDASAIVSITTEVEWPPKSGRFLTVPEADRAEWFTPARAREKILPAQAPLLGTLERVLGGGAAATPAGTSRTSP